MTDEEDPTRFDCCPSCLQDCDEDTVHRDACPDGCNDDQVTG